MTSASSIIRISIVGDVKKLVGALGQADKATGGLLASTAKVAGGVFALEKAGSAAADFFADSVNEFDRLGDASARLEHQLGALAGPLIANAEGFERLGASKQDIIEMEARISELTTTIGVSDSTIAAYGEQAVATAAAISLLTDKEPAEVIDLISKAAGGSAKAAKELGVTLAAGADSGAQLVNILTQLKPKLDDATTGTMDLEQHQKQLQARIETLQGKIGEGLNPVILDFWEGLELVLSALPKLGAELAEDIGHIEDFGRELLTPIARINDMIGAIGNLIRQANLLGPALGGAVSADREVTFAERRERERNGLGRD